ncbi:hypothetical protein J1614_002222 [Plenodomus biglobosus]|nr:hypothetical protein J1614_002222 [Plenodomus biglobosus]
MLNNGVEQEVINNITSPVIQVMQLFHRDASNITTDNPNLPQSVPELLRSGLMGYFSLVHYKTEVRNSLTTSELQELEHASQALKDMYKDLLSIYPECRALHDRMLTITSQIANLPATPQPVSRSLLTVANEDFSVN